MNPEIIFGNDYITQFIGFRKVKTLGAIFLRDSGRLFENFPVVYRFVWISIGAVLIIFIILVIRVYFCVEQFSDSVIWGLPDRGKKFDLGYELSLLILVSVGSGNFMFGLGLNTFDGALLNCLKWLLLKVRCLQIGYWELLKRTPLQRRSKLGLGRL